MSPEDALDHVARATVTVEPRRCAGVLVEDGRHVLTVHHCVRRQRVVAVTLADGRTLRARVAVLIPDRDVALLQLDEGTEGPALPLAGSHPDKGDALLFAGRIDRRDPPRMIRVRGLSRCRSMPLVPRAIFTDLEADPGASGAPLVDRSLHVSGLVHGGARCHIATPVGPVTPTVREFIARAACEAHDELRPDCDHRRCCPCAEERDGSCR